jgi:hypothetical protein
MALMRCPQCHEIVGDYPDVKPTFEDGTAEDEFLCFDCICENLEGFPDDAA